MRNRHSLLSRTLQRPEPIGAQSARGVAGFDAEAKRVLIWPMHEWNVVGTETIPAYGGFR